MASLSNKIRQYVNAEVDFSKDVKLQDNSDGKGVFIAKWNLDMPKPTMEQLNAYETQANTYEANQQVIQERLKAYGSIAQQIEYITENGLEAWQNKVQQIKSDNPKE